MQHYINAFKNYVNFSGRASRPAYWYFVLFHIIVVFVLSLIDSLLGLGGEGSMGVLVSIYTLIALLPGIAITLRRLRDAGKSPWWILVGFVPLVGWIWLIVLLASPTQGGAPAKKA